MSIWLKQSTAATVKLGPFVDEDDGKTPETGLTISQADIRLSKNGGDFAQTNNATGATHDENGYYDIPLDTTDTNTLGRLLVAVSESGALPVWDKFHVVPANVYDWTLFDEVIEGSITAKEALRLIMSALFGEASGAGTTTITFRDTGDTKNRVVMTVDEDGNRSAVVLDGS